MGLWGEAKERAKSSCTYTLLYCRICCQCAGIIFVSKRARSADGDVVCLIEGGGGGNSLGLLRAPPPTTGYVCGGHEAVTSAWLCVTTMQEPELGLWKAQGCSVCKCKAL